MKPACHKDCRCNFGQDWEDVSFITPWLAVGGTVHDFDIPDLKRLGITHIINVNWPDRPEPEAVVAAFAHLDLAIRDDGEPKPPEWFQAGIAFSRTIPPDGKLLVHCGHGINRSPAMAYAILLAATPGMSPAEAEEYIRAGRPQAGSGKTGSWLAAYLASAEAVLA